MKFLTTADKATATVEYTKEQSRLGYPSTIQGTRFGPGPHADGGMVFTLCQDEMKQTADGKTFGVLVPDDAKPVAGCVLVDAKSAAWADAKPVKGEAVAIEDGPVGEVAVKGK
jgi:hypothetical protein